MSDYVIPDPEPKPIDEKLAMELRYLSSSAVLKGRPSGEEKCENCLYYLENTAARIDARAEAKAHDNGARVGISRPHESAHLHVAGEATYIDDIPELAGTLHCALGLSPVANGRLLGLKLDAIRAHNAAAANETERHRSGEEG